VNDLAKPEVKKRRWKSTKRTREISNNKNLL